MTELPFSIKVIGALALVYGIWNSLCSPFILLRSTGFVAEPVAEVFVWINFTLAFYMIVAGTGLLRRKEWGRKAIIYGLILGYSFLLSHILSFIALLIVSEGFGSYMFFIIPPLVLGCGAVLMLVITLIRYLKKPETKDIFA
jgi:hypothetical protein